MLAKILENTSSKMDSKESLQLTLFSFLWALATLFHLEWTLTAYKLWETPAHLILRLDITQFALAAAALALLIRPWSVWRLNLLLCLIIFDVLYKLPVVPNHWLLSFFISCTLLAAQISRKGRSRSTSFLSEATPYLCLSTIIFYGYAFFWKLNTGYFTLETSCSSVFFQRVISWVPFMSSTPSAEMFITYYTLIVEGFLPILLLSRRGRLFGVVIGVIFHFLLALDVQGRFLNFTSVMYPLLYLFIPSALSIRAKKELIHLTNWSGVIRWGAFLGFIALISSTLFIFPHWYLYARQLLWMVYGVLILTITLKYLLPLCFTKLPQEQQAVRLWPSSSRGLWIFPLLVFLNGAAPIIGVKTRSSWQMYSNLWIGPDNSNHYLVPKSLDLLGVMSDSITILESKPEYLKWMIIQSHHDKAGTFQPDRKLTYYELKSVAYKYPNSSLTYQRGDIVYTVPRIGDDPNLSSPPPFWQRKLFWFRRYDEGDDRTSCQW